MSKVARKAVLIGMLRRIHWLLRDEFTTALTAGNVDGTAAEPGPGTRAVTDTGSHLAISGGNLVLDGGLVSPAYGDPGMTYAVQTRTAGRMVLLQVNKGEIDKYFRFGFNQDAVNFNDCIIMLDNVGLIKVLDDVGGFNAAVGAYSASTDYYLVLIMRAVGLYAVIKGGVFTNWQLLGGWSSGTQANLLPSIIGRASTITSDFIRIPADLWLPAPKLSDGFGGTYPTTDGKGHAEGVAGGIGAGGGNLTWVDSIGTWGISGGSLSASALTGGIAIATISLSTPDVLMDAELTRSAGNVGTVVRYVDTANYVYAIHDGTNAKLIKRVAGTETDVISAVTTYSAGAVARIICEGTAFRLYYNDAQVGTGTISDAGLQNGTSVGCYTSDTGNTIDDAVCFARGSSGEYSELNKYIQ